MDASENEGARGRGRFYSRTVRRRDHACRLQGGQISRTVFLFPLQVLPYCQQTEFSTANELLIYVRIRTYISVWYSTGFVALRFYAYRSIQTPAVP